MTILAELRGSIAIDPRPSSVAVLDVTVQAQSGSPGDILATMTPVAGLSAQLNPAGNTQRLFGRVTITGIPLNSPLVLLQGDMADGWEIEEVINEGFAWKISVPGHSGNWVPSPLLWEINWGGPPPGDSPVMFELVYLAGSSLTEAPYVLMTGGRSHASTREISRAGHFMEISGIGPEGCFNEVQVDYQLDPSHGKTQGEMIRELALLAGIPEASIGVGQSLGSPRQKALDVVCEEFKSIVEEIAASCNHWVDFDRNGIFRSWPFIPSAGPVFTLTHDHVIAVDGEIVISSTSDVPDCLVVSGVAPELPDDGEGTVTKVTTIERWANYAVESAYSHQQLSGAITTISGGGPLPSKFIVVERITTIERLVDGCVHSDEVITEQYFAPRAWRYQLDTAGAISSYQGPLGVFFYEEGVTKDDQINGFAWQTKRLTVVSRVQNFYTYLPELTSTEVNAGVTRPVGALSQVDTKMSAWKVVREAIKERIATSTTWESQNYRSNLKSLGDGTVVTGNEEFFDGPLDTLETYAGPSGSASISSQYAESSVRTIENTDEFYKTSEVLEARTIGALPGGFYLLSGGEEIDRVAENGIINETERTTYEAIGENSHRRIISRHGRASGAAFGDHEGRLEETEITEPEDSYLPASDVCSRENLERSSGRPFEVEVCDVGSPRCPKWDSVSNDFIETEDEAVAFGERVLRQETATTVVVSIAANAALRRGDPIRVSLPRAGVTGVGWLHRNKIVRDSDGGTLSMLEIKLPVI